MRRSLIASFDGTKVPDAAAAVSLPRWRLSLLRSDRKRRERTHAWSCTEGTLSLRRGVGRFLQDTSTRHQQVRFTANLRPCGAKPGSSDPVPSAVRPRASRRGGASGRGAAGRRRTGPASIKTSSSRLAGGGCSHLGSPEGTRGWCHKNRFTRLSHVGPSEGCLTVRAVWKARHLLNPAGIRGRES